MQRRPEEDLDLLRRRLYAPGSTEQDLDRYRVAAGRSARRADAGSPAQDAAAGSSEPPRSAPARRRLVPLLVAALLVGVLAAGGALLAQDARTRPAAVPTPPAGASPVPEQVLAVPHADRDALVTALRGDGELQLGLYLYLHPAARPHRLGGITRFERDERRATGTNTIDLALSARAAHGGRTTVVLVVDRDARAVWTATQEAAHAHRRTVAAGAMCLAAGGPGAAVFAYTGDAPSQLTVEVPQGVRWGALIAWTD